MDVTASQLISQAIMQATVQIITDNDLQALERVDRTHILNNNITYLKICAHLGRPNLAKYIIYLEDQSIPYNYLLHLAVASNQYDMVKLFIQLGASVNSNENLALRLACCSGYIEIAQYLLNQGATIAQENDYCLAVAASNGHQNIIELLFKHQPHLSDTNSQAKSWALQNNQNQIVQILRLSGISSDITESDTCSSPSSCNKYILEVRADSNCFWIERIIKDHEGKIIDKQISTY